MCQRLLHRFCGSVGSSNQPNKRLYMLFRGSTGGSVEVANLIWINTGSLNICMRSTWIYKRRYCSSSSLDFIIFLKLIIFPSCCWKKQAMLLFRQHKIFFWHFPVVASAAVSHVARLNVYESRRVGENVSNAISSHHQHDRPDDNHHQPVFIIKIMSFGCRRIFFFAFSTPLLPVSLGCGKWNEIWCWFDVIMCWNGIINW